MSEAWLNKDVLHTSSNHNKNKQEVDMKNKFDSTVDSANDVHLKDKNNNTANVTNSGNSKVYVDVKVDSATNAKVRSKTEADQDQDQGQGKGQGQGKFYD